MDKQREVAIPRCNYTNQFHFILLVCGITGFVSSNVLGALPGSAILVRSDQGTNINVL
jgi:hypothetical protein